MVDQAACVLALVGGDVKYAIDEDIGMYMVTVKPRTVLHYLYTEIHGYACAPNGDLHIRHDAFVALLEQRCVLLQIHRIVNMMCHTPGLSAMERLESKLDVLTREVAALREAAELVPPPPPPRGGRRFRQVRKHFDETTRKLETP